MNLGKGSAKSHHHRLEVESAVEQPETIGKLKCRASRNRPKNLK